MDISQLMKYLAVAIVTLVVALSVNKCNRESSVSLENPKNLIKTDTVTTTDTVVVFKDRVVPAKPVKIPVPYETIVYAKDSIMVPLVYNRYKDTVQLDSLVSVNYDMTVAGSLTALALGYSGKLPVTTVTNTTTITNTVDRSRGLYLGGVASSERIGLGAQVTLGRHNIGYNYGVLQSPVSPIGRHQIGYHYRIAR